MTHTVVPEVGIKNFLPLLIKWLQPFDLFFVEV